MISSPFENLIQWFIPKSFTKEETIAYEIIRSEGMTLLVQEKLSPQFLDVLYLPLSKPSHNQYLPWNGKYKYLYGNPEHTRFIGQNHLGDFVDINFELTDPEKEFAENNQERLAEDGFLRFKHPCKQIPISTVIYPYSITLDDNEEVSGYISTGYITDSSPIPEYK